MSFWHGFEKRAAWGKNTLKRVGDTFRRVEDTAKHVEETAARAKATGQDVEKITRIGRYLVPAALASIPAAAGLHGVASIQKARYYGKMRKGENGGKSPEPKVP